MNNDYIHGDNDEYDDNDDVTYKRMKRWWFRLDDIYFIKTCII